MQTGRTLHPRLVKIDHNIAAGVLLIEESLPLGLKDGLRFRNVGARDREHKLSASAFTSAVLRPQQLNRQRH